MYGYVRENPITWTDPSGLLDLNLLDPNSSLGKNMSHVDDPDNGDIFTIGGHSTSENIFDNRIGANGMALSPQQLADLINGDPALKAKLNRAKEVVIYGCNAGARGVLSFADGFAD